MNTVVIECIGSDARCRLVGETQRAEDDEHDESSIDSHAASEISVSGFTGRGSGRQSWSTSEFVD